MKELGLTEQEKKEVDKFIEVFGSTMLVVAISDDKKEQLEVLNYLRGLLLEKNVRN